MSNFKIEHPGVNNCNALTQIFGSPEQYNRLKGRWVYCLHSKWTNKNDDLRRACDRANDMLNDEILELEIIIWGSDNKELAKEFDIILTDRYCIFIAVQDGNIISKNESLDKEIIKDWVNKTFKKPLQKPIVQQKIEENKVIKSEGLFSNTFKRLF
jgi:hypothetical protein